jgi:hypothetical protein
LRQPLELLLPRITPKPEQAAAVAFIAQDSRAEMARRAAGLEVAAGAVEPPIMAQEFQAEQVQQAPTALWSL